LAINHDAAPPTHHWIAAPLALLALAAIASASAASGIPEMIAQARGCQIGGTGKLNFGTFKKHCEDPF
jgi:spore coat protein U-like protein